MVSLVGNDVVRDCMGDSLPWVVILCLGPLGPPLLSISQFESVWLVVFLLGSVGMATLCWVVLLQLV